MTTKLDAYRVFDGVLKDAKTKELETIRQPIRDIMKRCLCPSCRTFDPVGGGTNAFTANVCARCSGRHIWKDPNIFDFNQGYSIGSYPVIESFGKKYKFPYLAAYRRCPETAYERYGDIIFDMTFGPIVHALCVFALANISIKRTWNVSALVLPKNAEIRHAIAGTVQLIRPEPVLAQYMPNTDGYKNDLKAHQSYLDLLPPLFAQIEAP